MRTTSLLARLALVAGAGLLPAGVARGETQPTEFVITTESTVGLLEPPIPRAIAFGPQAPAGSKVPSSLGTLKYSVLRLGVPRGPLEGFLLGWKEPVQNPATESLYVDPDSDGDLANGGNGDMEVASDMRVRRSTLQVKRPDGDPDNVSLVPFVFVRKASASADEPWHAFSAGRRTGEVEVDGKSYAFALVDVDGDGSILPGKDVLWFDSNGDGIFDPDPAARERLAIPAIVKAGPRLVKLSVPFPSGLKVKGEILSSGEPQAGLAAPVPTFLSWRLAYAAASATAVDERTAAVVGVRGITDDATWNWIEALYENSIEASVRGATLEGLGNPAFGADRSAARLKVVAQKSTDASLRARAIAMLGGHPGSGAANFLKTLVEDKNKPMNERINAMFSLARFPDSLDVVKRHMTGSDPPELRAAAYSAVATVTPDDIRLHKQALEMGSPAARGLAIAALGRLGDPSALPLARKEATSKLAQIRAGALRVLVQSGKKGDLTLAVEAAQDDSPIEKFTDRDGNGHWDKGEPFVDGNGNGVYDPDGGIRQALKEALRAERGREEILKFVIKMLDHREKDGDWVRDVAFGVLSDLDDTNARTALFKHALPETVRDLKIRILEAAGKAKKDIPIDDFVKIAADKDEAIRAAASSALVDAAPEDPRVRDLVKHLLESPRTWTDLVQGCEAAGHGSMSEAVQGVIKALDGGKDKRWNVKAAAVEALQKLHPKEAFDHLLVTMGEAGENSRISLAIKKVLFRMTGMELPDDPDQWRSWAAGHPDWQVPVDPPIPAELGRRTVAKGILGVPIDSTRVVFVLDRSGSMLIPDSSGERVRSRWEILVDQLNSAITNLPKKKGTDVLFNIVFFSSDVDTFKPRSVRATDEARDAAKKFVSSLEPKGETNVWKAITTALDEPDVDTIILLTDGEPSMGEFTKAADILREVSLLNRFRRVVISTISMGQDSALLRDLALQNHGTYARK